MDGRPVAPKKDVEDENVSVPDPPTLTVPLQHGAWDGESNHGSEPPAPQDEEGDSDSDSDDDDDSSSSSIQEDSEGDYEEVNSGQGGSEDEQEPARAAQLTLRPMTMRWGTRTLEGAFTASRSPTPEALEAVAPAHALAAGDSEGTLTPEQLEHLARTGVNLAAVDTMRAGWLQQSLARREPREQAGASSSSNGKRAERSPSPVRESTAKLRPPSPVPLPAQAVPTGAPLPDEAPLRDEAPLPPPAPPPRHSGPKRTRPPRRAAAGPDAPPPRPPPQGSATNGAAGAALPDADPLPPPPSPPVPPPVVPPGNNARVDDGVPPPPVDEAQQPVPSPQGTPPADGMDVDSSGAPPLDGAPPPVDEPAAPQLDPHDALYDDYDIPMFDDIDEEREDGGFYSNDALH
ncbi:hypothetical protein AURDEDRAFT_131980, partial [Auricularia subglabra TFB-10046 SS5]